MIDNKHLSPLIRENLAILQRLEELINELNNLKTRLRIMYVDSVRARGGDDGLFERD